jgi:hypothetical protein
MHNLINECPICKSKQLVNIGGKNTVYGLVELNTDGTKSENPNFLPVVVSICRDCGHVEFRHFPITKPNKD